ncbi:MAG: GNAT family N-acetyltransferase [Anaerolineales bacterium]|jgi:ribosomal protein S18 acetylase RimI-like enzyme
MRTPGSTGRLRKLLETDRNWCAYALADLYPPYVESSQWLVDSDAVVLMYQGVEPPMLFAHGDPNQVHDLMQAVEPGKYQFGLMGVHRDLLGSRLRILRQKRMWRMVLDRDAFPPNTSKADLISLSTEDLPRMLALFGDHPDAPDAFHPSQLAQGSFFGIRRQGELLSVSGIHVVSPLADVAALGNVFTHPSHRGQGFARRASAAVVESLLERDIGTLVLNVDMENQAAINCYQSLGFWPFCGYYEGVADLAQANT